MKKRQYVHEHLANIEYRTKACADKDSAEKEERALKDKYDYLFPT